MVAQIPPLPALTQDDAEAIDRVTDYAFWQLMLGDDLEVCERNIDLLCGALLRRWGAIAHEARRAQPATDRARAREQISRLRSQLGQPASDQIGVSL